MDGTRYVDGVLVDTTQLSRTENSKAFHILRDRVDNWESGIHNGLKLTVNPVNTSRVDMSAGTGYAVDGEYVEVQADQLNIQLADTALGAINWVLAFYTETKASPNPHETNGTIQPTENQRGVRIRVLKPSDFALLPLTDPTYASDAQDRALLVGIVTGTGGALTSSNIEQPLSWRSLKYAIMATPPMSGVSIYKVSDDTPEGTTGVLKLEVGPVRLSWQAPTEAAFGASVNITADGVYTLTALGGSTIQVVVTVAALPIANTQVTVAIRGLYTQDVPRMSSTDRHHRSLIGTGIPSPVNPHGLSIDDITPGFATDITLHQQLMHANGIWRGSLASCLQVTIDEAPNPDRLLITAPAGVDCYWVHGKRLTAITNTTLEFTDPSLPTKRSLFDIIVDNVGNVKYSQRVEHTGTNLTGNLTGIVFVNDEVPAGAHTLSWLSLGPGNGGYLSWNGSLTPARVLPGLSSGLILLRNGTQEVWFYIGDINQLPNAAGLYSDVITVFAVANRAENLLLAQVFYDGNSTGALGYTNNRGTVPALLVDLRLFGTMLDYHMRDDALREMIEYPMDEHHANGVAIGRLDFQGAFGSLWTQQPATGLTLTIWGQAPVYVRGKRFVLGSFSSPLSVTVPDNSVTVVYVDVDGNIAQTPLIWAAMLLLNSPVGFESTKFYKTLTNNYTNQPWVYTGTPLAVVASFGGNVSRVIDLRRNLSGGNVGIRPWTVGGIVPTLLTPAYQAVEFYSLDTAMLYALVQGQERIECVYATLANPTATPYVVPTFKNLALTGTLFIDGNWSTLSSIFRLGDGANISFEDLQIFRGASFVGAATLSLVETTNGAAQPSTIIFENAEIDWLTNGHLAHLISTGPVDCRVVVDNLAAVVSVGSPALIQVDTPCTPLQVYGIKTGAGSPIGFIGTDQAITVQMSDCVDLSIGAAAVYAPGGSVAGSFSGVTCGEPIKDGGAIRAEFANCTFGMVVIEDVLNTSFAGCYISTNFNIGSASNKGNGLRVSGCHMDGPSSIYCDDVEVSGSEFSQNFGFGGAHLNFAGSKFGSIAHSNWDTYDVHFAGCTISALTHTAPSTAFDFYDWHVVGGALENLVLNWGTEELRNFSISDCKVMRVVMQPTSMPAAAAKPLDCSITNCDIDLTSFATRNLQFSFCSRVRVNGNRVKCVANWAKPPVQFGQGYDIFAQLGGECDVTDNTFEIIDVSMAAVNVGSPVVVIADEFPAAQGMQNMRICNNRFVWRSASASVMANKVMCITHLTTRAVGCRYDHNSMVFEGDGTEVAWDTAEGAVRTAMRMGLLMGFQQVNLNNHFFQLVACSFIGNTMCFYGSCLAGKWILYDANIAGFTQNIIIGNTGQVPRMRAYPVGVGVAFTDFSINSQIDNT